MKCLVLSNQSRSMQIFWRVLIKNMIKSGYEVVCCAPAGDNVSELELAKLGVRFIGLNLDRKGLNPFKDICYYNNLKKIFIAEKPDILFATTIKPVIYGCFAAHAAKIPGIFATITGLGYVFENDSFLKKILMKTAALMYRHSLKYAQGIFFQNNDDAKIFCKQNILNKKSSILFAKGTGVDINYFADAPLPSCDNGIVFLLAGRLLKAKGIEEYAMASKILKKRWPNARFQLLGIPENGPGAMPLEQINKWEKEGLIEYLGQTRDIRPYVKSAHVAVLPSWREGLPTFLMEAMSMGRPCIATDVPGCRELVKDGINGFLSPVQNAPLLAKSMEHFLANQEKIIEMGAKSREIAEKELDAEIVSKSILNDIKESIKSRNKND